MPALFTHQLSFQLDNGDWLFKNLNFSLNDRLTGMVGRNGAGKSVFLSLLLGRLSPTQGNATRQGKILSYSQLPSSLLHEDTSIADYLGINKKLDALKAIEQGRCDPKDFEVIGDDWDIIPRTEQTLKTLRIKPDLNAYCRTLSGGQLAMLQLHVLFESNAEILLLDEPSNHLDSIAKQWLIKKLSHFEGQVLLISHDRALLRHVDAIYQLTSLGLLYFKGNYDTYLAQSTAQTEALDRQIIHAKSEQKRLERQAQTNKEKAQQREAQGNRKRKSGSQPKILMDAMKESAGQSLGAKVTNQDNLMASNQAKLQRLKQQKEILKPQAMYLQQTESSKKKTLLQVENCQLAHSSGKPMSFTINQTERWYISGPNGCGKSTLLKAIHGAHANYEGSIRVNGSTSTVYLDQHFGLLKLESTILDSLMTTCHELAESDARILLAGIGFRRDSVYRKVAYLSGGEKMKLAMLMVSHIKGPPLLLLDEPDNHLDIESKQILATALNNYRGAFILISHDQDFVRETELNKVVTMT
ncbi:ABC transporter ATP-binding protein [Photobacterium sanctipauli]|uniref:ABC transporter ATP-binding protein n=1 Tax=Photobacterium sanctipauli TaxID=1342794 RepID=A0A2T3NZS4_9GAMM|nr:ATP-binding cassette domain-containing protein [Photobacterium sanctipauli]PSW21767.1 ABC transporter ATP-binding protein [Photobacterium sanctipauli]